MLKKKNKFFSDVIIMGFGSIITRIFQFVFIITISRYFGTEVFGYYGTANTASIFFMIFFGFGSGFYLTREVAFDKNLSGELFNGILKIRILLLIVGGLIFLPIIGFSHYTYKLKLLLVLFFFIGASKGVLQQFNQLYQAYKFFKTQVLFEFGIYFGLLCIGLMCYILQFDIVTLGFMLLFYYSLYLLFEMLYVHRNILRIDLLAWNKEQLLGLFKSGLPFLMASLVGVIYHRIDIFMLGFFQDQSEVGLYVAPYNMYEAFLFIPAAFGNVIFPRIVPLLKLNHFSFIKKHLGGLMYSLMLVMLPIMILLIVFATPIIELTFGSDFLNGSIVLVIISGGLIFHSFNNILGRILYAVNQEKYQLKISVVAMFANVLLNLILIPKYSIIGASISTIISFALSFLLHYLKVRKEIGISMILNLSQRLKIVLISLGLTSFAYFILINFDYSVIFKLILSLIAYFILLILIEYKNVLLLLNKRRFFKVN
jgi:O-antigen/teichoic acid export membrane protein